MPPEYNVNLLPVALTFADPDSYLLHPHQPPYYAVPSKPASQNNFPEYRSALYDGPDPCIFLCGKKILPHQPDPARSGVPDHVPFSLRETWHPDILSRPDCRQAHPLPPRSLPPLFHGVPWSAMHQGLMPDWHNRSWLPYW